MEKETQGNLFRETAIEKAAELAAWVRHEILAIRGELRERQGRLAECERTLMLVEGMIGELAQGELFGEGDDGQ